VYITFVGFDSDEVKESCIKFAKNNEHLVNYEHLLVEKSRI
jgi:hypothetical protein